MKQLLKSLLFCLPLILSQLSARSQVGNNEIQVAAQISFPTGDLNTVVKRGYGYAIKGLWGIGKGKQQLTAEISNNFFDVKDMYLNNHVEASYSSWPIYGGYRRYLGGFYAEGQLGIAVNTIKAFTTDTVVSNNKTDTYFAWAFGIGYKTKYFDLGTRFQTSPISNSPDISFVAIRLAGRIPFFYAERKK